MLPVGQERGTVPLAKEPEKPVFSKPIALLLTAFFAVAANNYLSKKARRIVVPVVLLSGAVYSLGVHRRWPWLMSYFYKRPLDIRPPSSSSLMRPMSL